MNEISLKDIENLNDIQLSKLLQKLLVLEANFNNLTEWEQNVPFNITTGDGGEDGRIKWTGIPHQTKYFKSKFTVFQNKATILPPRKCYEELLEPIRKGEEKRVLKSQIKKLVDEDGCFVLFTNIAIVEKGKEERISKFRDALKDAGCLNYENFQIEIFDANKIKDWCNEYLTAVTLVQGFNGITRPQSFINWEEWDRRSKSEHNKFQVDDVVKQNKILIGKSLTSEKVVRITGHSGLGKTRLVLESFRNSIIRESLVYYDLAGIIDISSLKSFLISHQDSQSGTVVVDNCDFKSHNILSDIVKSSGMINLVTIGLDDSTSVEDLKIKLEREKQRDLVKCIVEEKIGETHSSSDKSYIATMAEGYPWMAIRFCDTVRKEGMKDLSKIPIDEFIKRLIFGSGDENEIEYNIIRACSVFSSFGFLDDSFRDVINEKLKESLQAQMNFIRTRIYEGEITEIKFNETCRKFLQLDIIEKRGLFYVVKPTILAIGLASSWLINTNAGRIKDIIQDLQKVQLEEKFVGRLKDLDQIDKAKDIVGELWGGANSPFGTAEVLNTSLGSLLFRYVVEVNPVATAQTIYSAFINKNKNELKLVSDGRRNLVRSLEKLCFRNETFDKAAKVLFSFAVAENESWGNNATSQFVQLFQVFLAGTETELYQRINIIKWGLAKNDHDFNLVAMQALARGLKNQHFSRVGSSERQGSSPPLKDHQPSYEEIKFYHEEILTILQEIASTDNVLSENAQLIIANSTRELLSHSETKVLEVLKVILNKGNKSWLEIRTNLKNTLKFEKHLQPEIIAEIKKIIDDLTPNDLRNQLLLIVTKPEWSDFSQDASGIYIDKPKSNAIGLAKKILDFNIDFLEFIPMLLEGEQRQSYNFGYEIGKAYKKSETIIEITISALKKIDIKKQNIDFLIGVLNGAGNIELINEVINKFIGNENLRHHSFYLVRMTYDKLSDIFKLFSLVNNFNFPISHFQGFMYGRSLEKLTNDEIILLSNKISQYGNGGAWTSLSLMFMHCFNNEELLTKNGNWFRKHFINTNMLVNNQNLGIRHESHHWSESLKRLLDKQNDPELAKLVVKQIVEFCNDDNYDYSLENDVLLVLKVLIKKYFAEIWQTLGDGLIGDYLTYFHIKNLVGERNGNLSPRKSILFHNEEIYEVLFIWCKEHPEIAPERIANMMPLSSNDMELFGWHPFSMKIINEFGNKIEVLENLSSNMGTFGSVGSRIPYYEKQKKLLEILLTNKNTEVRDWAADMIDHTVINIKREKLNEEHRNVL